MKSFNDFKIIRPLYDCLSATTVESSRNREYDFWYLLGLLYHGKEYVATYSIVYFFSSENTHRSTGVYIPWKYSDKVKGSNFQSSRSSTIQCI